MFLQSFLDSIFYHTYTDITGNTQRLGGNKIYGEKYFRSISAQYHGKAGGKFTGGMMITGRLLRRRKNLQTV